MITFKNQGEIDLRAVRTFGANSKESANPIGFFGTGLKYAVAVVLRSGGKITLWRGTEKYEFGTAAVRIRVDDFDVITMNGDELGFTTQLGKTWEMWEAFREIYCNTRDEGGQCFLGRSVPEAGHTVVAVEHPAFDNCYHERHAIVLESTPWLTLFNMEVHAQPSQFIYYRGVRVMRCEKPTLRTYNLTAQCGLTENRTLGGGDYSVRRMLREASYFCADRVWLQELLNADADHYEAELDFSWDNSVLGPVWQEVVATALNHDTLNKSARDLFLKKTRAAGIEPEPCEPNELERQQLDEGVHLCKLLGYDVDSVPVVLTHDLPSAVLGLHVTGVRKLFISRACLTQGAQRVAGTLIEEFLHCHYGFRDESRAMQNHLLDGLANAAVHIKLGRLAPVLRAGERNECDDDPAFAF